MAIVVMGEWIGPTKRVSRSKRYQFKGFESIQTRKATIYQNQHDSNVVFIQANFDRKTGRQTDRKVGRQTGRHS